MTDKKNYKIWIPVEIMQDPRTIKLIAETGYKGLGVLFNAIITVDQYYMTKPTLSSILGLLNAQVSRGFCKKILCDYGFFSIDEKGNIESLLRAGARAEARESARAEVRAEARTPPSFSKVHIHNLEEKAHPHPHEEIHKFNNSLILDSNNILDSKTPILDLIRDLKNTQPDRGELWEGVLLCCPDQELRKLMVEHWSETVDYLTKHLESRSTEISDKTSLCNILRELVQPSSLVFSSLKLFLAQEVKSDSEKAFDRWLSNLNNICLMQEPLTFKQFNELVQICHDPVKVRKTAERLNNYPSTPTRYVSAYKTMMDWLENPR